MGILGPYQHNRPAGHSIAQKAAHYHVWSIFQFVLCQLRLGLEARLYNIGEMWANPMLGRVQL